MGSIIPGPLAELFEGRRPSGGGGNSSGGIGSGSDSGNGGDGGTALKEKKIGAPGGDARIQVRYDTHLTALYLWDIDNLMTLLEGTALTSLNVHVICKNWHLCRMCWEECERKNSHVPTPPRGGNRHRWAAQNIPRGLK